MNYPSSEQQNILQTCEPNVQIARGNIVKQILRTYDTLQKNKLLELLKKIPGTVGFTINDKRLFSQWVKSYSSILFKIQSQINAEKNYERKKIMESQVKEASFSKNFLEELLKK